MPMFLGNKAMPLTGAILVRAVNAWLREAEGHRPVSTGNQLSKMNGRPRGSMRGGTYTMTNSFSMRSGGYAGDKKDYEFGGFWR